MSPKIASETIITDAIITRVTFHFLSQACFQGDASSCPQCHKTLYPYVCENGYRRLEVATVPVCLGFWFTEDPVTEGPLNSNMTCIPYCTCTHVTSKIYPRPRVLACVESSATALHKSLPQTDWHVVSQLRRAQLGRVGTQRGGGARERPANRRRRQRAPPMYSRDKSFSGSGKLLSLLAARAAATAPPFPRGLLYRAATLRPRKEAYYHNRRPQSLCRTRDPTNNLPKRTDLHQGGEEGKWEVGKRSKR